MKQQLPVALVAAIFAFNTSAQTTTTSSKTIMETLKASPFSASVFVWSNTKREKSTHKVNGLYNFISPSVKYKMTDKDSFKIAPRFDYTQVSGKDSTSTFNRFDLSYSRSGLLSEKEDGLSLSAGFRKRVLLKRTSQYGSNRLNLTASKSLGEFSLSSGIYYLINDVKNTEDKEETKRQFWSLNSQSYQLTDKASLSLSENVYQASAIGSENSTTELELSLSTDYNASKKVSFSAGASIVPMSLNAKNKATQNDVLANTSFYATAYIVVF